MYENEMRLFDPKLGQRLYVDSRERDLFLNAANKLENRQHRLFCHVLHWTGARISEILELTGQRIDIDRNAIIIRTLKKRKKTAKGEIKQPQYRQVPVPTELINSLDLLYNLRSKKKKNDHALKLPLWESKGDSRKAISRSTGWRIVKRIFDQTGIEGPQATAKGFRHGFGVAMVLGGMDIYTLQHIMGHERAETTAIYLQVKGQEAHELQMQYWKRANKNWEE
jgi:integrase